MSNKFDAVGVEAKLLAYIATYCNEYVPQEESAAFFVKVSLDLIQVMVELSDRQEEDELLFLYAFDNIKTEINRVIDEAMDRKRKEYEERVDGGRDGKEETN